MRNSNAAAISPHAAHTQPEDNSATYLAKVGHSDGLDVIRRANIHILELVLVVVAVLLCLPSGGVNLLDLELEHGGQLAHRHGVGGARKHNIRLCLALVWHLGQWQHQFCLQVLLCSIQTT